MTPSVRFSFALLLFAACTAETAEDRLQSLIADNKTTCHEYSDDLYCDTHTAATAATAADCMTNALAMGARAKILWHTQDAHLFVEEKYMFTVDGHVETFDYYPGPWTGGDESHVVSAQRCTGPFRVQEYACPQGTSTQGTVIVDGCSPQ